MTANCDRERLSDIVAVSEFADWRSARVRELAAPDGWLGLIGLFWLEACCNTVGADPAARVFLSQGSDRLAESFTHIATCPLPPPESSLPFPVPAGEMEYADR